MPKIPSEKSSKSKKIRRLSKSPSRQATQDIIGKVTSKSKGFAEGLTGSGKKRKKPIGEEVIDLDDPSNSPLNSPLSSPSYRKMNTKGKIRIDNNRKKKDPDTTKTALDSISLDALDNVLPKATPKKRKLNAVLNYTTNVNNNTVTPDKNIDSRSNNNSMTEQIYWSSGSFTENFKINNKKNDKRSKEVINLLSGEHKGGEEERNTSIMELDESPESQSLKDNSIQKRTVLTKIARMNPIAQLEKKYNTVFSLANQSPTTSKAKDYTNSQKDSLVSKSTTYLASGNANMNNSLSPASPIPIMKDKKAKTLVFPINNSTASSSRGFLFKKRLSKEKSLSSLAEFRIRKSQTTEITQATNDKANDHNKLHSSEISSVSDTSSGILATPVAYNGNNSLKDLLSELRFTSSGNINYNKLSSANEDHLENAADDAAAVASTTSMILDQGIVFDEVECDIFSDKLFEESHNDNTTGKEITQNTTNVNISAVPNSFQYSISKTIISDIKNNEQSVHLNQVTVSEKIANIIENEKENKLEDEEEEFGSDDFDFEELDRKIKNKALSTESVSNDHIINETVNLTSAQAEISKEAQGANVRENTQQGNNMDKDAIHVQKNDSEGSTDNDDAFSDFDDEELFNKLTQRKQLATHAKDIEVNNHNKRKAFIISDLSDNKTDINNNNDEDEDEDEYDINMTKLSIKRPWLHRFQIAEVHLKQYSFKGVKKDQIILKVKDSLSKIRNIVIRDNWLATKYDVGEVIHVIGENPTIVDNERNFLILNPDTLISATTLGDSLDCERRSSLKSRYIFPGESSKALIVGNIVHEVFQKCLSTKRADDWFLNEALEESVNHYVVDILSIFEEKKNIINECQEHIKYIKVWIDKYMHITNSNPSNSSVSVSSFISTFGWKEKTNFSVSKVLDIEENIWSPIFGLRGLLDATIEASIKSNNNSEYKENSGKFIAPMEIKSGKDYISHKAQTSLYTLLMKDRYDTDVNFFVLVYTKLCQTTKYQVDQRDLRMLLIKRNTLSKFLRSIKSSIPPLIKNSICDRCFIKDVCMSYTKLVEEGTEETSGFKTGEFNEATSHMKPAYGKFYKYWESLLNKEENFLSKLTKEIWIYTSQEREEKGGKSISDLIILNVAYTASTEYYVYTFIQDNKSRKASAPLLGSSTITLKDMVLISDQDGHFSLSSGFVIYMSEKVIKISTKRRIDFSTRKMEGFDSSTNQTFKGVLGFSTEENEISELDNVSANEASRVSPRKPTQTQIQVEPYSKTIKYRLDKYPVATGLKLARYNLLDIFMDPERDMLRNILIDKIRKPAKDEYENEFRDIKIDETKFNQDQIRAMQQCFLTEDFSLILGMPGTGKTTTITEIIKHLISKDKSVLIASYTHSAVDNILIKLKEEGVTDIIRLGALNKVHNDVKEFNPYSCDEIFANKELFLSKFINSKIVATTCLGINDWVFNHRKFDYCIIDEASQVSMPICLGPIRFSDRFILVGDHYQLPPLIMSPKARKGLSQSLFKILSEQYPSSVIDLTYQYRMCDDIMLLTNTLIYNGRLKSGSKKVANKKLNIPEPLNLKAHYNKVLEDNGKENSNWMNLIYKEDNKVIFLNHDEMDAIERINGDKVENPIEAELINVIVESLLAARVDQSAIGVMSLYRAQIKLISDKLRYRKNVEILTADRFQGLDKECIIISLVRSNDKQKVGELLKEWRRINVAITRAKSKLIIIGSKKTLKNLPIIDAFMKIIETKGWLYNLPKNALDSYDFFTQSHNSSSSPASSTNNSKKRKTSNVTTLSDKLVDSHLLLRNIIVDDNN